MQVHIEQNPERIQCRCGEEHCAGHAAAGEEIEQQERRVGAVVREGAGMALLSGGCLRDGEAEIGSNYLIMIYDIL